MHTIKRRTFLLGGAALAAGAQALRPVAALAQGASNFPNKPIRFIVGFAAGGGTDTLTRIVAAKASEILGQTVIVENRTGAGGQIAVEYVQNQPKDGYTVAIGAIGYDALKASIADARANCTSGTC